MLQTFHNEMSVLEKEAANMQKEFEKSILIKPQFIIKIVIKF